MMKALIDTNVIIDYLANRIPFADDAERIFDLCEQGELTGVLTASAMTDVYYIMRKSIGHEKAMDCMKLLFSIFDIANVGKDDLLRAMESGLKDFEDALVAVCARRIKAECIITRNTSDFTKAAVLPMTPRNFMERFFPDMKEE